MSGPAPSPCPRGCGSVLIASRRSCVGCGLNPGKLHNNGLCLTCQHPITRKPEPIGEHDTTVCQLDGMLTARLLRAWARATAFGCAAGYVPAVELRHALAHLDEATAAEGLVELGRIDRICAAMLRNELAAIGASE